MCPILGCRNGVKVDLAAGPLLCSYHWFRVPPRLRGEVMHAWHALEADPGNAAKHAAYQAARDEAIAAV